MNLVKRSRMNRRTSQLTTNRILSGALPTVAAFKPRISCIKALRRRIPRVYGDQVQLPCRSVVDVCDRWVRTLATPSGTS